jgi:hypothetical protein
VSDVAMTAASVANKALATAKGPVQALRGTSEADNELRNVRDCLWNEAEEIAHYNVIEAAADALGDKDTAKLARTYRREEEKMQSLLERQIAPLVKAVIKEEVPASERSANGRSRSSSRRTSSAASSRSTASRAASPRAKSTPARAKSTTSRAAKSTASRAKSTTSRAAKTTAARAKSTTARAAKSTPSRAKAGTGSRSKSS